MWSEAFQVAAVGFTFVFAVLVALAVSVKVMSAVCRGIERKGRK